MRHINYLLLSFLIIVLAIPNYCTAQMQSTLITSTKRTIPVSNVKPIKSLPLELNTDKILTLSQYENGNTSVSIFSLTDNNTNAVLSCTIANVKIEDFVLYQNDVFFCGKDLTNNLPFFARVDVYSLIGGTNNIIKYFPQNPTAWTFSKIDFYINNNNEEVVNLIGDNTLFASVNLTTFGASAFIPPNGILLESIRHTRDLGVILTKMANGIFGLYAFNRNTISLPTGWAFSTPTLYTYNDSIFFNTTDYRYLLEPLDTENTNNVAVGFSSTDTSSGTEICNINLENMSIVTTQAVITTNEARSCLFDMKYSREYNGLICLIWNPAIKFTDNIFMMYPSNTQPYPTPVTIPELNTRKHLLYYLTPYQDKYYLAAGNINNRVYLFDKITLNYNYLSCITEEWFKVEPVNAVGRSGNISMSLSNIHFSATSLTSSPIQTQHYSLDCK